MYNQDVSEEVIKAAKSWIGVEDDINNKNWEVVEEKCTPMLNQSAYDILKQRKRIGGNWSVDFAVFSRKQRDGLRKILGSDLIFIILNMTKQCQEKRLIDRHGNDKEIIDLLKMLHTMYEPGENDEENTYNVTITEDMCPEDVVQKILENIK